MRLSYKNALCAVMYFIACVALLCLLGTDFYVFSFTHFDKLVFSLLFFVFGACGTRIYCIGRDFQKKHRAVRGTVAIMFIVYLIIVVDFTLIDDTFGRSISSIFTCGRERLFDHINNDVNLVPFKTVRLFINSYKKGLLNDFAIFENLVGNFCVLMPFAFFVPILFKKINGGLKLFAAAVCFVIVIELLQFVFMTGCADIDDLILNVAGCMAAYGFFRIKKIDKTLHRATYGMWRCNE